MLAIAAYTWVKFFHIVLAIIAVGFNASYGFWISRAAKEPEHQLHVLRGIKIIDDRIANPAYGLLLVTGLVMVKIGHLKLGQFWLLTALIIYGVTALTAIIVYTPTLRKQIQLLEAGKASSQEFARSSRQGTMVGAFLGVLVFAIVFLMVTKPTP
jgi:uncharacterized membrane protein